MSFPVISKTNTAVSQLKSQGGAVNLWIAHEHHLTSHSHTAEFSSEAFVFPIGAQSCAQKTFATSLSILKNKQKWMLIIYTHHAQNWSYQSSPLSAFKSTLDRTPGG